MDSRKVMSRGYRDTAGLVSVGPVGTRAPWYSSPVAQLDDLPVARIHRSSDGVSRKVLESFPSAETSEPWGHTDTAMLETFGDLWRLADRLDIRSLRL